MGALYVLGMEFLTPISCQQMCTGYRVAFMLGSAPNFWYYMCFLFAEMK